MKSILFVTGTRADFGKLEPLAVAARDAEFAVSFFVTGMHMMPEYGLTKLEVARVDGVDVHEYVNQDAGDPQDAILAQTILGFSAFVKDQNPDLVVVHGDRVEALACALVCATNYIRCAHVEGGEVSGTIDEMFRHCNTKLAYCHFVSAQSAARRVRALGEPDAAIYTIGSPELDFHARPSGISLEDVRARYDITFPEFGVCTFHPVTSEAATMGAQAAAFFGALQSSGRAFVVILPNNDPGAGDILAVINTLPATQFRLIPSMRFAHFSQLMKNAACIVGNSSAGVREAPFLGVPSLDIGTRQNERADGPSITICAATDTGTIAQFLQSQWGQSCPRDPAFGVGRAAELFVDALRQDAFWSRGLQKNFQDYGRS